MAHSSGWPTTIVLMLLLLDVLLGLAGERRPFPAVTATDEKRYCQSFGKNNTVCRYHNKGCKKMPKAQKINRKLIKEIVHEHNRARQLVAKGQERNQPSASNMMKLNWNKELQKDAQIWANQCKFAHDKNRLIFDFPDHVGQNVAVQWSTERYPMDFKWAIKTMWFDSEIKSYRPDRKKNKLKFSKKTGHYTQMVWAQTTDVGCGFAQYKKGAYYFNLYVCNYGPGGNIRHALVYKLGRPASKCPPGTSQSKTYRGLCA